MTGRPILDVTSLRMPQDTSRLAKVERLARELRREIELGVLMGELQECVAFDFIVLRHDDKPALRGRFDLRPMQQGKAA